ncbi:MAG TPA: hypothetical protein VHP35_05085, partial [Terriglobia bacterium]|nr:hypothetical protein [Terriglobia bacterium]
HNTGTGGHTRRSTSLQQNERHVITGTGINQFDTQKSLWQSTCLFASAADQGISFQSASLIP